MDEARAASHPGLASYRAAIASAEPVEPSAPVRFGSTNSLLGHLRKHVLESRAEGWRHLIDAEGIAAARRADAGRSYEETPAPEVRTLAAGYEGLLSRSLLERCTAGTGHGHLVRLEPSSSLGIGDDRFSVVEQRIHAWDTSRRLVIVVRARVVSGGGLRPYRLLTGYRVPDLGREAAFGRRCLRRLKESARQKGHHIIAIHDQPGPIRDGELR